MGEPHGEYSPAEEEQFSLELQMALELSLQELSIRDFNTDMERVLEGDVHVSSPVALPKDHPVVAEIRADVEREEADDLKQQRAQSSIRDAGGPQKKVLERLSQASTWANLVASERSRVSDREVPDLDLIPCRDVGSSPRRAADDIPRLPVGQGALKKVPRKKRSAGGSESSEEGVLPSHRHTKDVLPPRREPTPPTQPPTDALPRLEPQAQEALPPKQQLEEKDSGRRTPPSDTEIFLTELEIARQNSLLENWAPPIGNDAELQIPDLTLNEVTYGTQSSTSDLPIKPVLLEQAPPKSMMVDTAAFASAETGTKSTGEIMNWLSSAQRHDPQLVKMARAIKDYLARKGSPDARLPCKHSADKCGCIYVTDEYLDKFGMKEAVCDDLQSVSGGSDLELTSSGEHMLDSPRRVAAMGIHASKATEELRLRHGTMAAQAWLAAQRCSREDPAPLDYADPEADPAAFVEHWYKRALQGQSSGSDTGDNNNTVDQVCGDVPKRTPNKRPSGEKSRKLSAKSQETNGSSSRKKYGNKKLTSTPSWNTATRVRSPVREDTLKLGPIPGYIPPGLLLRTLPTVNKYPPEEDSSSPSNQVSDDTTPDTMETDSAIETDSESASDRCPDVEKTEKL